MYIYIDLKVKIRQAKSEKCTTGLPVNQQERKAEKITKYRWAFIIFYG